MGTIILFSVYMCNANVGFFGGPAFYSTNQSNLKSIQKRLIG